MTWPSASAPAERRRAARRWLLATLLLASPLLGQSNSALADGLFRQGRAAMKAGNFALACPKFEESQRLDPSVGTLLNLALCEEARGRIATAAAHFRDLLETAPQDDRARRARQRLDALTPRLPRLTLRANRTRFEDSDLLWLDGVVLSLASLGGELPIDPGEHELLIHLDGRDRRHTFSIAEKEHLERWIDPDLPPPPAPPGSAPVLAPSASPAPPPVAPSASPPPGPDLTTSPAPPAAPAPPAPGPTPSRFAFRDHRLAWGLLGVGTVSLLAAATAGVVALREKQIVERECPERQCSNEGLAAGRRGHRAVLIGNITLITGLVGVGVGSGLMLYSQPGGGVVALGGTWR